jgi:cell division control protein 6
LPIFSVFKDRNKLSPRYIPKILPHREKQIELLNSLFEDALDDISKCYLRPAQLIGGVGTGKTCTSISFGDGFQEKARSEGISLNHVYMNLKLQGGSRVIFYRGLMEKAAPEISSQSLGADEMLLQLVKYLRSKNIYLLVTLDEIEYFIKHVKERVIYDLTRLGELHPGRPSGIIGAIFIARSTDFQNELDKSELSTLGRSYVDFPSYSASQIVDILDSRVDEAFVRGAVSSDVIEYVADITSSPPVGGDARYALDLLLYAGNLADNLGMEEILPDHVRRVHGEICHAITSEDILSLPDKEKIVLLSVARILRNRRSPYISFKDIREDYGIILEEFQMKPIRDLEDCVQDLLDRGIIDFKSITRIGITGVPTENLIKYLDNLIERVKSGLSEC